MVRVVRTPLCIEQFLRDEEPFFIGMVAVPDTPTKPKDKEEKPPKTAVAEIVIPPLPKPARLVDVGDVLEQFEF